MSGRPSFEQVLSQDDEVCQVALTTLSVSLGSRQVPLARVVDPLTCQVEAPVDLQVLHVGVLRISPANVMATHGRSLTALGKG